MPRDVTHSGTRFPMRCTHPPTSSMVVKSVPERRRYFRLLLACALMFELGGVASHAADPAPTSATAAASTALITSTTQFWTLPDAKRHLRHAVRLEFIVYYHDPYWKLLWGQNEGVDSYWTVSSFPEVIPAGRRIL